jgi:hypothetical protein
MYTPVMFDFTTGDRYWTEQEDQLKKRMKSFFSMSFISSAKNRCSVKDLA